MANEKILNTRISLKYDSYENWIATANQFKLRPGEVAVVNINGANGANLNNGTENTVTQPTILFKVGIGNPADDTTWKTFNQLPWASALAADVYSWAKLSWDEFKAKYEAGAELDVSYNGEKITYSHEVKLNASYTTEVPTDKSAIAFGDSVTIKVPKFTANEYGHITAAEDTEYTITLPTPEAAINTVTKVAGNDAIKVEDKATDGNHNYEVSLVLDNSGNVALSQSADGLKAEIADATIAAVKVDKAARADAATKVDNALTVKVGGADVVFDGSEAKTANVDAAIAAAINTIPEQTNYTVTITEDTSDATLAKKYIFTQNGSEIGSINLAKELVVTAGSVKEVTEANVPYEGAAIGDKYIELVIANQDTPIYVPAKDLVDIYTAAKDATEVQVAISNTNEISATLVTDSVTTAKIADGAVTEAKLEQNVQDALTLARTALQSHQDISHLAEKEQVTKDIAAAIAELDSFIAATPEVDNKVSVLTGITQEDGELTGKTEVTLAAIAKTGSIYDIAEGANANTGADKEEYPFYLIFDCGSSTEVI